MFKTVYSKTTYLKSEDTKYAFMCWEPINSYYIQALNLHLLCLQHSDFPNCSVFQNLILLALNAHKRIEQYRKYFVALRESTHCGYLFFWFDIE